MHKVLVIVDMQKDFTTGVLGNEECKAAISKVTDVIRQGDYDEYFLTRDTHGDNYLSTQEGKKLPVPHCIKGTDGWKIVNDIETSCRAKRKPVHFIDKPVFGSVELGEQLRALYEKYCAEGLTIDFVGVCTGICVISNVLIAKANCPEAVVRVIADACACVTVQSHQTALEAMKTCQVDII